MFHGSHVLSSWHSTLYHSWWSWTLVFLRHQSNHKHTRPQHRVAAFCSPRCIALWRRSAGGALPRHASANLLDIVGTSLPLNHGMVLANQNLASSFATLIDMVPKALWLQAKLFTFGKRQAVLKIAHAVTHFHRHVKATGSKKCFTFILTAQVLEHLGR